MQLFNNVNMEPKGNLQGAARVSYKQVVYVWREIERGYCKNRFQGKGGSQGMCRSICQSRGRGRQGENFIKNIIDRY